MRFARLVAFAAAALGAVLLIGASLLNPPTPEPDWLAYHNAAGRLLSGQPLYPVTSPDDSLAYRYSPWLAFAWIPLNLAGRTGEAIWFVLLGLAAVYIVAASFRLGGHAGLVLGVLALPALTVGNGNVAILMLALLIATRIHPVAVGIAASLKIYPLLLVAGYVAERRWRDAMVAIGIAALLWAPALAFDLSGYIDSPGGGGLSLYAVSLPLWLAQDVILVAAVGYLALRRSKWTWLALAAAVPIVLPRVFLLGPEYFTAAARRIERNREPDSAIP